MRKWVIWQAVLVVMALAVFTGVAQAQPGGGTIAVRDSSTGTVVPNIGDDTNDALRVNIVAGAGSGGTSQADNSAVTTITGIGALYDTTPPSITDGNVGLPRMSSTRILLVDGSGATQPISAASLPLPTGASTLAEQQTQTTALQLIDNLPLAQGSTTSGQSGILGQGAVTTGAPSYTNAQTSPLSLTTAGDLRVTGAVTQSGTWTVQPGNTANTTAWLVKELRAATPTLANVAASASSVTCLASNANRLGASIYNDSTAILYAKFGATASTTSFTQRIEGGGTYEVPFGYTGIVDCIWSAANGSARTTELTQ